MKAEAKIKLKEGDKKGATMLMKKRKIYEGEIKKLESSVADFRKS